MTDVGNNYISLFVVILSLTSIEEGITIRTHLQRSWHVTAVGQGERMAVAAQLARRSLDCYRSVYLSSQTKLTPVAGTGVLYASELLAKTLSTQFGQTQSALYVCQYSEGVYNLQPPATGSADSGSATLWTLFDLGPCHPLVVEAHSLRRKLWAELGLVQRIKRASVTANQSAQLYYNKRSGGIGTSVIHPGTCQAMFGLSEALAMSGSVDDAICVGVECLATRIKV